MPFDKSPLLKPTRRLDAKEMEPFVRFSRTELFGIPLSHLASYLDPAVARDSLGENWSATCLSGSTEWQAAYSGRAVSLAWDWVVANDGALILSHVVSPRTNIVLVDQRGRPLSYQSSAVFLTSYIESIEWRASVLLEIKSPVCLPPSYEHL